MDKQIATRVTAEEYAELERNAEKNERSVSAETRLAVRAWLTQLRKKAATEAAA